MKDVAVYLRISRADNENEDTLLNHRTRLEKVVKDRGYNATYYEEIVSGAKAIEERHELFRLLGDIKNYDGLLAVSLDRLSRDELYFYTILKVLEENNVPLITPDRTYDLRNKNDRMMMGMLNVFASNEYRTIVERMTLNKADGARRGEWIQGRPPIGYKRGDDKHLEIVESERKTIERIFDLAEAGYGIINIVPKMLGYTTREGKEFNKTSIHRILHNPIYKGTLVYNPKGSEPIVVEEAHTAIISEEQWDKVQSSLKGRTSGDLAIRTRNRGNAVSILSGLVFCNKCNRKMRLKLDSKQKDIVYLNPCQCGENKGVRESVLLEYFYEQFDFVEEYFTEQWQKALNNDLSDDKDALMLQVSELTKQAEKLTKRLENLLVMRMDGEISKTVYLEKEAEQQKQLLKVNTSIRNLQKEIDSMDSEKVVGDYVEKLFLIKRVKESTDVVEVNRLLKMIIDEVRYQRYEEKVSGTGEIETDVIEVVIAPK
ncbi:MAG: recombinase family protein [Bacillota bacterium]